MVRHEASQQNAIEQLYTDYSLGLMSKVSTDAALDSKNPNALQSRIHSDPIAHLTPFLKDDGN